MTDKKTAPVLEAHLPPKRLVIKIDGGLGRNIAME